MVGTFSSPTFPGGGSYRERGPKRKARDLRISLDRERRVPINTKRYARRCPARFGVGFCRAQLELGFQIWTLRIELRCCIDPSTPLWTTYIHIFAGLWQGTQVAT